MTPSPYLNGLNPWYGCGGHEEATSGIEFVRGKEHDYRTREVDGGVFSAEQRRRGGVWEEISSGHKTSYIAATACAMAEGRALARAKSGEKEFVQVPPEPITLAPGEPEKVPEPKKKLSALDRLRGFR